MMLGYRVIMIPSDFHSWHISPFKGWICKLHFFGFPVMTHQLQSIRTSIHDTLVTFSQAMWSLFFRISTHDTSVTCQALWFPDFHGWLHISHFESGYVSWFFHIFFHETSVTLTQDLWSMFMITSLHSWHINHIKSGNVIMITSDL